MRSPASYQRKSGVHSQSLRYIGAAVLLFILFWTILWQAVIVPAFHASGTKGASGPITIVRLFARIFGTADFDHEPDEELVNLFRDPCSSVEDEFPTLSYATVTVKAVSWAVQKNRWQGQMDACKCKPDPGVPTVHNESRGMFDVRKFGAAGDGRRDDSGAIARAFRAACKYSQRQLAKKGKDRRESPKGRPLKGTVHFPATCFFTRAVDFAGPCGAGLRFQVDGTILGPLEPSSYPPAEYTSQYFPYTNGLLTFRNFRGLEIVGGGTVEGQGFIFWQRFREKTLHLPIRPFAIRLMRCIDTYVRGITLRNSPMYHLFAYGCKGLTVSHIRTHSPSNSPNTDSLKLVGIEDCHISDSLLHGGDDDVSIVAVEDLIARNVTIEGVRATAGHGISIGSVGWNGTTACISDILVRNVSLEHLSNGLRIKSWRGGKGIVRNVRYENIRMDNIRRAIALNQFYCDAHQNWTCGDDNSNVVFYNISYSDFSGTIDAEKDSNGIQIACSDAIPCTGVEIRHIKLKPELSAGARFFAVPMSPKFGNLRESTVEDLGELMPSGRLAWHSSFPGAEHVTPEQAENIKQSAAYCSFGDFHWMNKPRA